MDPVLYRTILDYKTECIYPPNITKKEKNEVRRKASKYVVEGKEFSFDSSTHTSARLGLRDGLDIFLTFFSLY